MADGAGSAEHSGEGSAAAVRAASEFLEEVYRFWRPEGEPEWLSLVRGCTVAAREAVIGLSTVDRPLRSFHTTLLVLGMGAGQAAACNVGDCGGIVARPCGELVLLAAPANGEYINETYFITEDSWEEHLQLAYHGDGVCSGIAFSDALQFIALRRGEPFAGFVSGITSQLRRIESEHRADALVGFLQEKIAGERTDDDITLVAAWQTGETE